MGHAHSLVGYVPLGASEPLKRSTRPARHKKYWHLLRVGMGPIVTPTPQVGRFVVDANAGAWFVTELARRSTSRPARRRAQGRSEPPRLGPPSMPRNCCSRSQTTATPPALHN